MSNLSIKIKSLFSFVLLTFCMVVAGCLPSNVNMKPPVTSTTPLTTDGVVVAKVINVGASVFPFNQFTITPKNVKASKDVKYPRLQAMEDPYGDTSLFASAVPAGEYSLENVRSFFLIGEYIYSIWADGGVNFGVFKVEPGKITDLGTFIAYRKVDGDKYSTRLVRIPNSDNEDLIKQYRPFLGYNKENLLTWQDDGLDSDRQSAYLALAQNPSLFVDRYLSPNGSLFMLGKLGAILERTKSGEWKDHLLETNSDLYAIAQDPKGRLIVGGAQGALFFKDNHDWKDISFDVATRIDGVKWLPNGEALLYMAQNGTGVIMQGNPALAKPDWKKISSYVAYKGWQDASGTPLVTNETIPKNIRSRQRVISLGFENFLGNDYVRVAIQQAGGNKEFNTMDRVDNKIFKASANNQLTYASELSGKMDRIFQAGQVSIGLKVAGFWSWTGRDAYYRYDTDSKTWVEIKTSVDNCPGARSEVRRCKVDGKTLLRNESFRFTSRPLFMSQNKGFATVQVVTAYERREPIMVETLDGGKSWRKSKVTFPGKFCTDLIPEITDRIMLYCSGVSGDVYESLDEGKTWMHIREHSNF
jgi:hypothetical protein